MDIVIKNLPYLIGALPNTFLMLFSSVFFALILGMILTMQRLSKHKIINAIAKVYISFMRGTPILVQLLIVFIALPMILRENGIETGNINNMVYAVFAFSLNEGAFFSEIFRSSYLAIDKGQIEAAYSLGMTKPQVFFRLIIPETMAIALPNTTNMIIELMKNTALGAAIGVYDILAKAQQLALNNYGIGQRELFITVSIIFWLIGLVFMAISNQVVARLNKGAMAVPKKTPRKHMFLGKRGEAA